MSLFSQDLKTAKAALESVGLSIEALKEDPDALEKLLNESSEDSPSPENLASDKARIAPLAADTAKLEGELATAKSTLATTVKQVQSLSARASAYSNGLKAAGIKNLDTTSDELTEESVAATVKARVSTLAAESLASSGHPHAIEDEPADPTKPAPTTAKSSRDRTLSAFQDNLDRLHAR